jgi:septum formation protein
MAYPRPVISSAAPLGLGSASPRRKDLLERLGIPLFVLPAGVDERRRDGEPPETYLERVTREKLEAVTADERASMASVVLTADTIVLVDDEILGKPEDAHHAQAMLARLAGRAHEVRTRFALGWPRGRGTPTLIAAETVCTKVFFRELDEEEINRYVATGEGADKAGAYAIQGVGSFAVSRIEGSYSNVVGLPICEVVLALQQHGLLGSFP